MTAPEGDHDSEAFAPAKLPPKTRKEFLLQASLLNLGLLLTGAGVIAFAFTERTTGGILLTGMGGLLLGLAYLRYSKKAPPN